MDADDRQSFIEIDVGFMLSLGDPTKCRKDVLDQGTDQLAAVG
jgi:hypothetical protein